jgi:starch-binding outer membrane protein, SusD/RagB family
MNQTHSALRVARAVALLAAFVAPTACDVKNELLQPQNPGIVDQSAVGSPSSAAALKVGAMGRLKFVVSDPSVAGFAGSSIWEASGLFTDEFMNSDFQNSQNDVDARTVSPDNSASNYVRTTQARGFIRDAIAAETQFEPAKTADIGELWMALGYVEMTLAENFCNGIPLGSNNKGVVDYTSPEFKPLMDAEVFQVAITHFDSALAILGNATDVNTVAVRNATLIAKARTLVDLGKFAEGAALVPASVIPTAYQYVFITQGSSNGDDLGIWTLNNSIARMSVGDSVVNYGGKQFQTLNAIPFASMNDPRVPVVTGLSLKLPAEDGGQTPLFVQQVYKGRDDPIPMVSGLDARLIEAEAKLQTSDFAGMMTILNALRTAPPKIGNFQPATMTAIATTPATKDAAATLFFREKALWQYARGQRLSDLRRLVRQYGRTQDKVFPSGQHYKGGTYGTDTSLPVSDAERVNPQFSGCIDRNA